MRNWYYQSIICCLILISAQVQTSEFLINRGYKGPGLGAFFCSVLGLLHHYDSHDIAGVSIEFNQDSFYYDAAKGLNWWEYYFNPISLGDYSAPQRVISRYETDHFVGLALCILPISRCNYLIKKYITVKPHIIAKVNAFFNRHLKGKTVIGVHYRGTDKKIEVKRVDYAQVRAAVKSTIKKNNLKNYVLFVASDEQAFIDYMKVRFQHVVYTKAHRSVDGKPLHYTLVDGQFKEQNNGYILGEECVVDMLLLARSEFLVRTASCVSVCALCFNPSIKVVSLSIHPWAPCSRSKI